MTAKIVTWAYGNGNSVSKIRLVADEGKILTKDGEVFWNCIDVDSIEGWVEIDSPYDEPEEVE